VKRPLGTRLRPHGWAVVRATGALVVVIACAVSARAALVPGDFIFESGFEPAKGCLSSEEADLVRLINEYRVSEGKAAVPATYSLTLVGQWKVLDLTSPTNPAGTGSCNLFSWSPDRPSLWTGCCYTPDHAQAQCMWDKPREITELRYGANGYELVASGQATVAAALSALQGSPAHNDVLLNLGPWSAFNPWPAMGVGVDLDNRSYAIWFADGVDPLGAVDDCTP
jgi:hypothetical protein